MKKLGLLLLGGLICLSMAGCCISHSWEDATCTDPKTCTKCGKTEGEALGHTWSDATCTTPKTCSACGATEGEALGHTWNDATCTTPKTCSICGETEGEALGHEVTYADCVTPAICERCGEEIEAPGHTWQEATCAAPKTCSTCGETEGEALPHEFENGICKNCGCECEPVTYEDLLSGKYDDQIVRMQVIVSDVEHDSSNLFDYWVEYGDTYVCLDSAAGYSEEAIEEKENLKEIAQIKNGDVLMVMGTVWNFSGAYSIGDWQSVEIVGHSDISDVFSKVISNAEQLPYRKVLSDPSKYSFNPKTNPLPTMAKTSGKVFQVVDDTEFLLQTSDGLVYVSWEVNTYADDYECVLEDDQVSIYGEIDGDYDYVTVLGAEKTVPKMTAIVVVRK